MMPDHVFAGHPRWGAAPGSAPSQSYFNVQAALPQSFAGNHSRADSRDQFAAGRYRPSHQEARYSAHSAPILHRGSVVQICGLVKAVLLNGKLGVVDGDITRVCSTRPTAACSSHRAAAPSDKKHPFAAHSHATIAAHSHEPRRRLSTTHAGETAVSQ